MTDAIDQDVAPVTDGMLASYKIAVERAMPRLPVKNGVIDIDSIWIETSIPYELLQEILRREDLKLPDNVERINLKSRVEKPRADSGPPAKRGGRRGSRKRKRKR
jgi:hypothetical protein